MKVTLLNMTDPGIADMAAKCCISRELPDDCSEGCKSLKTACASGHLSILEHINATFSVEGVSRSLLAQFSRHRHISLAVQSQRYVDMDGFDFYTPISIATKPEVKEVYEKWMAQCADLYQIMTELQGVALEDARLILPNACCTNFIVTLNLRSLSQICAVRRCDRAQIECRRMVGMMAQQVVAEMKKYGLTWLDDYVEIDPNEYDVVTYADKLFGPNCCQRGYCPEKKGRCGRFPDLYALGEEYWIGEMMKKHDKEETE